MYFCHSSEGQKSKIRTSAQLIFSEGLWHGHLLPASSNGFPSVHVCIPISSRKDTGRIGLGPIRRTSFYLNYLFKGSISNYSHPEVLGVRALIWIWRPTVQPIILILTLLMNTRPTNPASHHTSLYRYSLMLPIQLALNKTQGVPLDQSVDWERSLRIISDCSPLLLPHHQVSRWLASMSFVFVSSLISPVPLFEPLTFVAIPLPSTNPASTQLPN